MEERLEVVEQRRARGVEVGRSRDGDDGGAAGCSAALFDRVALGGFGARPATSPPPGRGGAPAGGADHEAEPSSSSPPRRRPGA
ncbi:MAG: hypothetical protein KIT58_01845 [Planctomycetota bacterium]|nr:hypothetical protein [Planctomycetota bacterium]